MNSVVKEALAIVVPIVIDAVIDAMAKDSYPKKR